MSKIILLLSVIFLAACNSDGTNSKATKDSIQTQKTIASSWTNQAEMEFMDACVEGAKQRLGEEKSFNQCKCILRQMQENNPTNDSLTSAKMMMDTARIAGFARNCQ